MAELIRRRVQELCKTFSKEQKDALATLAEIKADAKVTSKAAMNAALKTQKEVRRERKTGRRLYQCGYQRPDGWRYTTKNNSGLDHR